MGGMPPPAGKVPDAMEGITGPCGPAMVMGMPGPPMVRGTAPMLPMGPMLPPIVAGGIAGTLPMDAGSMPMDACMLGLPPMDMSILASSGARRNETRCIGPFTVRTDGLATLPGSA
mmetsp:Transcript_62757/g.198175  ORF Transcript_62757/g.198175 Transcript_62757/m.198175 type:complete len:116 (+) Transcript_62757:244-591(+)